jgi:hypothetical protein
VSHQPTVYMIEAHDRFKIGKSICPLARVTPMEVAYGHLVGPMFLRFFAYGTTKEERATHHALRGFLVNGMGREWFWRDPVSWKTAIDMLLALPECMNLLNFHGDPYEPGFDRLERMRRAREAAHV